jgi:light-regulated signal transduction histidine kinase (bacteriophytochrome)
MHQTHADLQEKLERAEARLALAQSELAALSYAISHDLRAPLRSIDGFSQALIEDFGDDLDASAQDYLRRVRSNTQRMAALIEDVLQLSRTLRSPFRPEPLDLSEMAEEIARNLARSEPQRQVQWDIQPGLRAHGDRALLALALRHLLDNAWKFTASQPMARISFRAAEDAETGGKVYQVNDNGVGFDMNYAGKLFGPFQRMHTPEKFTGNGIGLALARRIIGRHDGRIWVEAAPEKGATFFFTLASKTHDDAVLHDLALPAIPAGASSVTPTRSRP